MPLRTCIVKHSNDAVRAASRSGGIFTALTDAILNKNGVVYGCYLNEQFEVVHGRATTTKQRDLFRCSKYVQSDVKNTFAQTRKDLITGKWVLYSGTSCQIAGLKSYLKDINTERLICVDIVCHGVPSPKIWNEYLKYNEYHYNGKVTKVEFINKTKYGWAAHYETIWIDNEEHDSKIWTTLFGKHYILRPACFRCPYKQTEHPGDITIGDAWGVQKANPEFNDNRGVSLVLVNTNKGMHMLNEVVDKLFVEEVDLQNYMQPSFVAPYLEPKMRKKFWEYYYRKGFEKTVKRYIELSFLMRVLRKLLRMIGVWQE